MVSASSICLYEGVGPCDVAVMSVVAVAVVVAVVVVVVVACGSYDVVLLECVVLLVKNLVAPFVCSFVEFSASPLYWV